MHIDAPPGQTVKVSSRAFADEEARARREPRGISLVNSFCTSLLETRGRGSLYLQMLNQKGGIVLLPKVASRSGAFPLSSALLSILGGGPER